MTDGETYTVATVTGAGARITTVAVAKTKEGKTKLVPVQVTRTVEGPGETEEVLFEVAGESVVLTETDTRILAQIAKKIETQVLAQSLHGSGDVTPPPETVTLPRDTVTLPSRDGDAARRDRDADAAG